MAPRTCSAMSDDSASSSGRGAPSTTSAGSIRLAVRDCPSQRRATLRAIPDSHGPNRSGLRSRGRLTRAKTTASWTASSARWESSSMRRVRAVTIGRCRVTSSAKACLFPPTARATNSASPSEPGTGERLMSHSAPVGAAGSSRSRSGRRGLRCADLRSRATRRGGAGTCRCPRRFERACRSRWPRPVSTVSHR